MKLKFAVLFTMMCSIMMEPVTAFAGTWIQDDAGWWYEEQDGTWASGEWKWIDSKCYYFDENGYCYMNPDEPTPDGYHVDANGAWIVDGVVQSPDSESDQAASGAAFEIGDKQSLIGKWKRVEEYNTRGGVGTNTLKTIEIRESGENLTVALYKGNATKPSLSYTLVYEEPFWVEVLEDSYYLINPSQYYVDEDTGRLVAFRLNDGFIYVEEFELQRN